MMWSGDNGDASPGSPDFLLLLEEEGIAFGDCLYQDYTDADDLHCCERIVESALRGVYFSRREIKSGGDGSRQDFSRRETITGSI
ncbi:hypothetical protein [Chitinophaga sp. RAB17]|uniref:hypothetical protein n=1 Tax=Chitinophaga sp. RAB17 TaxID=3233049 RepID=UPI003F922599